MMSVQPSEADRLSLWEYQALIHNWELAHSTEEQPLEPPSIEETLERKRRLEERGIKVLH